MQLLSAGRRKDALEPAIVISTNERRTKQRIEKHLPRIDWLTPSLRKHGLVLYVVISGVHAAMGDDEANSDWGMQPYIQASDDDSRSSLCGRRINIPPGPGRASMSCVVGGSLQFGDFVCLQTAWHPFSDVALGCQNNIQAVEASSQDSDPDTEDDQPFSPLDEHSAELTSNSSMNDCNDGANCYTAYDAPIRAGATGTAAGSAGRDNAVHAYKSTASPEHRRDRYWLVVLHDDTQHDWTTLTFVDVDNAMRDKSAAMPDVDSHHTSLNLIGGQLITDICTEPQATKTWVVICLPDGEVPGFKLPGKVTLHVGDALLSLHMVIVDRVLQKGCSGAWVTHENELHGMVLFIRSDLPWVYIMPAEPMFQAMEAATGMKVGLPTEDNRLRSSWAFPDLSVGGGPPYHSDNHRRLARPSGSSLLMQVDSVGLHTGSSKTTSECSSSSLKAPYTPPRVDSSLDCGHDVAQEAAPESPILVDNSLGALTATNLQKLNSTSPSNRDPLSTWLHDGLAALIKSPLPVGSLAQAPTDRSKEIDQHSTGNIDSCSVNVGYSRRASMHSSMRSSIGSFRSITSLFPIAHTSILV